MLSSCTDSKSDVIYNLNRLTGLNFKDLKSPDLAQRFGTTTCERIPNAEHFFFSNWMYIKQYIRFKNLVIKNLYLFKDYIWNPSNLIAVYNALHVHSSALSVSKASTSHNKKARLHVYLKNPNISLALQIFPDCVIQ